MIRTGRLRISMLVVVALTVFAPVRLAAQVSGRRPPTPVERALVQHYRQVILQLLQSFPNQDWQQDATGDYEIGDEYLVTARREVPFEITDAIRRTYRVVPGGPYYQRVLQPALEKAQSTTDPAEMKKAFEHVEETQLEVRIDFNSIEEGDTGSSDPTEPLHLPGVAAGWRVPGAKKAGATLLFGNWAAASHRGKALGYRFRKAGSYPAIENVVIELTGAPSRIDELLRTVDWTQVNAALTTAP